MQVQLGQQQVALELLELELVQEQQVVVALAVVTLVDSTTPGNMILIPTVCVSCLYQADPVNITTETITATTNQTPHQTHVTPESVQCRKLQRQDDTVDGMS